MKTVFVIVTACVVAILNALILQKEHLLRTTPSVLLELAPADPRSLMQGDYMRLNYQVFSEIRKSYPGYDNAADGFVVVALNEQGVGEFRRIDTERVELAANEHRIKFRVRGWAVRIGAESYFFQEGHGPDYAVAKFGELKVAPNGDCLLVGLRNQDLREIRPQ